MKKVILLLILILGVQGLSVPARGVQSGSCNDTVRIRHDLESILANPRFNYPDYFRGVRQLLRRLIQWWIKMFPARQSNTAEWFDRSLQKLGLALVVLSPLLILFGVRKFFLSESQIKLVAGSPEELPANLKLILENANRSAAKGDFRDAVRQIYLAALIRLRSTGSLPEGVRRSDKENLRTLAKSAGYDSPVYQSFAEMVRLFREKWYGLKSCTDSDYQKASRFFETLSSHAEKIPSNTVAKSNG
jgi:hypothetical protein